MCLLDKKAVVTLEGCPRACYICAFEVLLSLHGLIPEGADLGNFRAFAVLSQRGPVLAIARAGGRTTLLRTNSRAAQPRSDARNRCLVRNKLY